MNDTLSSQKSKSERGLVNPDNLPKIAGIYKLYRKISNESLELVYIGQSKNVRQRVNSHITSGRKIDFIEYIPEPDLQLRKQVEQTLIAINKPKYNKRHIEKDFVEQVYTKAEQSNVDEKELFEAGGVYELICSMYKGNPIQSHIVKRQALEKGIVNNKQTYYNKLERLKDADMVEDTTPNKERYKRIKPVEEN